MSVDDQSQGIRLNKVVTIRCVAKPLLNMYYNKNYLSHCNSGSELMVKRRIKHLICCSQQLGSNSIKFVLDSVYWIQWLIAFVSELAACCWLWGKIKIMDKINEWFFGLVWICWMDKNSGQSALKKTWVQPHFLVFTQMLDRQSRCSLRHATSFSKNKTWK